MLLALIGMDGSNTGDNEAKRSEYYYGFKMQMIADDDFLNLYFLENLVTLFEFSYKLCAV